MARLLLFPPGGANQFFYNVDLTVGPGSTNKKDDVQLVQFFIRSIFDNNSRFNPPFAPLPLPPGRVFKVDGIAGPITFGAIKHYQEILAARGTLINNKGRVDKVARGTGITTLLFLNRDFKQVRGNDFNNIGMAADCPSELRDAVALIG